MAMKDVKPYKLGDKLTKKQELWIDEYIKTDNYTTASRNAGYRGNDNALKHIGYENSIRFKDILEARKNELRKELKKNTIAELEDIFEFWTNIFTSDDFRTQDRIKASELLAKAKGGFIEKVEVKEVSTDWFIDEE